MNVPISELVVDCVEINGVPFCYPVYQFFGTVYCSVTATPSSYKSGCSFSY
jgi:hypothetical protein